MHVRVVPAAAIENCLEVPSICAANNLENLRQELFFIS